MSKKMRFVEIKEFKQIAETGSFEGLLSPYGNVDAGGDIVEPGSYTKTLKEQGNTRPLLWQHKPDQPVGLITLEDRPDGLWCKGQILMEIPTGQTAYAVIKAGIVKGLSIGFESVKESVKAGVRHLTEIKLYEGSIVTFPMNFSALISSVKTAKENKDDFNEELAEIQTLDARYQLVQALQSALSSVTWADLTREEKIALIATILQQFLDAYTAFFPVYLDTLTELYGDMEMWSAREPEIKARLAKAGAMFSAPNKKAIKDICDVIMGAHTDLSALISTEAVDDTSKEGAAALEKKTEPESHSAEEKSLIQKIIDSLSTN